jgi:hypothetical protein
MFGGVGWSLVIDVLGQRIGYIFKGLLEDGNDTVSRNVGRSTTSTTPHRKSEISIIVLLAGHN